MNIIRSLILLELRWSFIPNELSSGTAFVIVNQWFAAISHEYSVKLKTQLKVFQNKHSGDDPTASAIVNPLSRASAVINRTYGNKWNT